MATKTRVELVTRAAEKLQVIGTGQSLEDEDEDKIDAIVPALFAELSARDVYSVDDDDEIELSAFEWLAELLADLAAPDFGLPRDPNKLLFAESRLKSITASRATYEPMKSVYY